jgi:hypothetical protein
MLAEHIHDVSQPPGRCHIEQEERSNKKLGEHKRTPENLLVLGYRLWLRILCQPFQSSEATTRTAPINSPIVLFDVIL